MLRLTSTIAAVILSAAPVLADVTTMDLPRLTWPAGAEAGTAPTTTTTSTANGR